MELAVLIFDQLGLDKETIAALKKVCLFALVIYIPYFLSGSVGSDATVNDLQLYKKLFDYRKIECQLADKAIIVLKRYG